MNGLDDARLRAHLDRRGVTGDPPGGMAQEIRERVATTPQHRSGPAPVTRLRRGWLALAAVLSGAALVVASAGFKLPLPAPDGGSPALTVLSPSQLVQLLTETPAESWVDRVVIVDAEVEQLQGRVGCRFPCPIGYVSGTDRSVVVHRDSDTTFRSSGFPRSESLDGAGAIRGPIALRLAESGAVELIGPVHATTSPALVWSPESFVAETTRLAEAEAPAGPDGVAVGPLFVVDAWLAQSAFTPPCPAPTQDPAQSVVSFRCGPAAWLTPRAVHGDVLGTPASVPADGIRVQSGAYDSFAPNPARSGSLELPEPRRALYLVRSILEFPPRSCALCPAGPAYIVGRIDPISAPEATPSPVPPSLTVLGAEDFARFVAETPVEAWADRVVIVDADIDVEVAFCALQAVPAACPIGFLAETEPRFSVWTDPAPAYVDDVRAEWDWLQDTIEGPLALRLAASGHVELIGPVARLSDATVWPLWALVSEIERVQSTDPLVGPDGIAVGPLFLVDAWLVAPMAAECPAPAGSPISFIAAFECGNAAFLPSEAVQPTRLMREAIVTTVPEGSIRVQNLV